MKKKSEIRVSKRWLKFAEEDYRAALSLWENKTFLNRTICFHAQQYAEKICKGILDKNLLKVPRIHDLYKLAALCKEIDSFIPLEREELFFLSSVYIEQRYPTDNGLLPDGEPTNEDAVYAMQIIKKLKKWIETQ